MGQMRVRKAWRWKYLAGLIVVAGSLLAAPIINDNIKNALAVVDEMPAEKPEILNLRPVLWDGDNYKGLVVDTDFKNIANLSAMEVTVERTDRSTISKRAAISTIDLLNNGEDGLTTPFPFWELTFRQANDTSYWTIADTASWTKDTAPTKVIVRLTFSNGQPTISQTADVVYKQLNYLSLLPPDTQGPTIAHLNPAGGAVVGGQYKVSATVTDPSGVKPGSVYARFRDDNGKEHTYYLDREGETDIYSKVVNTNEIAYKKINKPGRVSFRAVDSLGNPRSSVSEKVIVDNQGPTIDIHTPVVKSTIGGDYRVSATVTDIAGVMDSSVYVRFRDDSGKEYTYYLQREAGTDVFSSVVNTREVGNGSTGPNRVSFFARDSFGTSRSSVRDGVSIDNEAPATPTGLAWKNSKGQAVTETNDYSGTATWAASTSEDVSHYIYRYWNDITNSKYTKEEPYTAKPTGLQQSGVFNQGEGVHYFCVAAVDQLGNVSDCSEPFTIVYDKTAPTAKLIASADKPVLGNEVTITGLVDADDIKSHWFEIKDPAGKLTYEHNLDTTDKEFSFALNASVAGEYRIRYVATDRAGNRSDDPKYTNSTILVVRVITPPPAVGLVLSADNNPEQATVTISSVEKLGNVYVDLYKNKLVNNANEIDWSTKNWRVKGQKALCFESFPDQTEGNKTCDIPKLEDGIYWLRVGGFDSAGNQAESINRMFIVDRTAPDFSLDFDSANPVSFRINSEDRDENSEYALIIKNLVTGVESEVKRANFSNLPYEADIPADLANGDYELIVRVNDQFGNQDEKVVRFTVAVEETAPEGEVTPLTITSLTVDNAGKISIRGTATPGAKVKINYGGLSTSTVTTNSSGVWSSTRKNSPSGNYNIVVSAQDDGRLLTELERQVTVTRPASTNASQRAAQVANPQATPIRVFQNYFATIIGASTTASVDDLSPIVAEEQSEVEVLGVRDDSRTTTEQPSEPEVLGVADRRWSLFGLAWYWWLVILAATVSLLWLIIALVRRNRDESSRFA